MRVELVSANSRTGLLPRKRKLENSEQRPALETCVQKTEMPEVADQRPVPANLTYRNVDAFSFSGRLTSETHCLADEPVSGELVSMSTFTGNREKTGNLREKWSPRRPECHSFSFQFKEL